MDVDQVVDKCGRIGKKDFILFPNLVEVGGFIKSIIYGHNCLQVIVQDHIPLIKDKEDRNYSNSLTAYCGHCSKRVLFEKGSKLTP